MVKIKMKDFARERDGDQGREKEEKFSCGGGQNNEPLEVPPTSQEGILQAQGMTFKK